MQLESATTHSPCSSYLERGAALGQIVRDLERAPLEERERPAFRIVLADGDQSPLRCAPVIVIRKWTSTRLTCVGHLPDV